MILIAVVFSFFIWFEVDYNSSISDLVYILYTSKSILDKLLQKNII